ncbi:hypothetical protein PTKIN_Ptkin14bG0056700 [Pterospermum kingtungense]
MATYETVTVEKSPPLREEQPPSGRKQKQGGLCFRSDYDKGTGKSRLTSWHPPAVKASNGFDGRSNDPQPGKKQKQGGPCFRSDYDEGTGKSRLTSWHPPAAKASNGFNGRSNHPQPWKKQKQGGPCFRSDYDEGTEQIWRNSWHDFAVKASHGFDEKSNQPQHGKKQKQGGPCFRSDYDEGTGQICRNSWHHFVAKASHHGKKQKQGGPCFRSDYDEGTGQICRNPWHHFAVKASHGFDEELNQPQLGKKQRQGGLHLGSDSLGCSFNIEPVDEFRVPLFCDTIPVDDWQRPLADLGIRKFNEDNGTNYKVVELEKCMTKSVRGTMFFITFLANRETNADDISHETELFETKIYDGIQKDRPLKVYFCRKRDWPRCWSCGKLLPLQEGLWKMIAGSSSICWICGKLQPLQEGL